MFLLVLEASFHFAYHLGLLLKGKVEGGSRVSGTSPGVHERKGEGNTAQGG